MREKLEKEMYPAVEKYFRKVLRCKKPQVDCVSLKRMLGVRRPDIAGLTSKGEVVFAEGKRLSGNSKAFDDCLLQIVNLKPFADRLYVFFPREDWARLDEEGEAQSCIAKLMQENIGLLLVDQHRHCEREHNAPKNEEVDKAKREQVKELLGDTADHRAPTVWDFDAGSVEYLGSMLLFCEKRLIATLNGKKGKKGKKGGYSTNTSQDGDQQATRNFIEWIVILDDNYNNCISIDFLGGYAGDGQPCVWIFRDAPESSLKKYLADEGVRFGTHICIYDGKRECNRIFSRSEVNVDRITGCQERKEEPSICHRIPLLGRSESSLKKEIESLLRLSKYWK